MSAANVKEEEGSDGGTLLLRKQQLLYISHNNTARSLPLARLSLSIVEQVETKQHWFQHQSRLQRVVGVAE